MTNNINEKKNLNLQVIRLDGKDCFVEAMSGAFPIGKVNLNFISYNTALEKGSKQTARINAYVDIGDFLVLAQDVLSGKINALAEKEKNSGNKYAQPVWTSIGGQSAKNANRPDGKALSRQVKLIPGLKKPFLLQAEQGVGEENSTGLIMAKYTKPEAKVMIPLTVNDLKKLVLVVKTHIEAFYGAVYTGDIVLIDKKNKNQEMLPPPGEDLEPPTEEELPPVVGE